jgi:two-component system NtrC family sensor kinase
MSPTDWEARCRELEREVEQLRALRAESERALAHREKLQALGQLISGVAHELANPLTAMIARAALIQTVRTLEAARSHAEIIEQQGHRATQIVRNLSSFARRRAGSRAAVSLNDVVTTVVEMHGYQLEANQVSLALDLAPAMPPVGGDQHELEQVVLNLVMNAQHAMVNANGRGRLVVRTVVEGDVARLTVQDDGPGIPADVLDQIFKPFFSTKGEAGTGLGLAIVKDLVTRHGGRISVHTELGAGTSMVVELPVLRADAAKPAPAAAPPAPVCPASPRARGLLLVVDDEPDIGDLIADLVRRRGYEAVLASSAAAALEILRTREVRGILTDMRMPGMSGEQLWQQLCQEWPSLARRTIFMTGDHAKPETTALLEATAQPCLTKPFRPDELDEALAALERSLDAPAV